MPETVRVSLAPRPTLVSCRLEYRNSLLIGFANGDLYTLHKIQKCLARVISKPRSINTLKSTALITLARAYPLSKEFSLICLL